MAKGFFITGTDTDVGKTTAAVMLIEAFKAKGLRVAAMKPVSAGCEQTPNGLRNDDALKLMAAANVDLPYSLVNPYAFEAPIAPHIAASDQGISMEISPLVDAYNDIQQRADIVIVEGAGGWLVPFDSCHTMADLAVALKLDVIQVVAMRLGCLNHALLTQQSIEAYGLQQTGWLTNTITEDMVQQQANLDSLHGRMTGHHLGDIPPCLFSTGTTTDGSSLQTMPLSVDRLCQ